MCSQLNPAVGQRFLSILVGQRIQAVEGNLTSAPIPLLENNVWDMVNARATGITAYLKNGGTLEIAQQMAGHASPSTTQLYDRRHEDVALDEVERILI